MFVTTTVTGRLLWNVLEYMDPYGSSMSMEESISRGAFVQRARVNPGFYLIEGDTLRFTEAWIEHPWHVDPHFIFWEKTICNKDAYRLHFKIDDPVSFKDQECRFLPAFWREETGYSTGKSSNASEDLCFITILENYDKQQLRLGLICDSDNERKEGITVHFEH